MAHTPGPWEARRLIPDGYLIKKPGWEIRTPAWDVATWIERGPPIRKEADAYLIAAVPDLLAAAEGGNEMEDIYLRELQRIAGPDATLSDEAQGRLHQLRRQRYAAIAAAQGPS